MGKFIDRTGEIRKSNSCGLMKIIEYNGFKDITVKFKTGFTIKTQYNTFKQGRLKDPLFPSVYGIGYIGIGKYTSYVNHIRSLEYNTWCNMIRRCYNPYAINKRRTYQDITICKNWFNFQNFAEWFGKNYYEIPEERIELDKDLIKRDNKIYCPEFCSFVPRSINTLLVKCDESRGEYPIGVCFNKKSNKYISQIHTNGKLKYLGQFTSSMKAFTAYKIAKEKQIKIMANKYKEYLPNQVYIYLINYEILITD